MKKDKIIGIVTIAAALLFVVYIAFAMWLNEKRARNTVFAQFHEMGALQNEDLVMIRGLAIGYVASIKRANDKALVEIDLYEPRVFRKDSKFRNVSPNIMGSRYIEIEPGKNGEIAAKDYIFDGEFEPGLAEVLALSDLAKEQVAVIMDFIRVLQTGDEDSQSLKSKFEEVLNECEELIETLSTALGSVEKQALGALNRVSGYADKIADASVGIDKTLDTLRTQARDGITAVEEVISKVNKSITSLNDILTQFENSPVTTALLDKRDIIDDIDSLRSALQTFVGSIDSKGIKIYDENGKRKSMVSLKNIHLIRETARSKAKKRAEQERLLLLQNK
ncbi:MAG: MlaD family protein [Fibromonadales bacterium]|nr:MlaD family protein [Fibromonadales bacterium]